MARSTTTTRRAAAPDRTLGTAARGRNPRKLVPPRDKAQRGAYYRLMGRARQASSLAQKLYLLNRARALMVWVEVEPAGPALPPPLSDGRPRPRRRPGSKGQADG